jgi:hypothetical protein
MTVRTLEVPKSQGRSWLEQSLAAGQIISAAILAAAPLGEGRFFTFIPASAEPGQIEFPEKGIFATSVACPGLAEFLDKLTKTGAACVLVEDDVLERGDRQLERMVVPSAFIGDGVVHWCDVKSGSRMSAAEAVRESAFGYPLNAFVVSKSFSELGLVSGQQAPKDLALRVTESLLAVIVSAFDGQSFAVWSRV